MKLFASLGKLWWSIFDGQKLTGPSFRPSSTFSLVLTTAVVHGCGRQPDPAPVENIQDILKETENAINQIKDEILETAENIKNE